MTDLGVPVVRAEEVCLLAELEGDDFVHDLEAAEEVIAAAEEVEGVSFGKERRSDFLKCWLLPKMSGEARTLWATCVYIGY